MVSEKLMRWFCPLFLFLLLLSLPQVTLLSLLLFYYYGLAVFIIIRDLCTNQRPTLDTNLKLN